MMTRILFAAAAAVILSPAAAHADNLNGAYAGVQGGYHGFSDGGGAVFGGYAGFNLPLGENYFLGFEGNFNAGAGDIKSDYGGSAHFGTRIGPQSVLFARAGLQVIDIDYDDGDGDDSYAGVLAGLGGEFGFGGNAAFRVTVDTLSFNTVRGLAGISYHF